jgi:hypothetical protein
VIVWRPVAHIGSQIGGRGGRAWRLVLDECGHVEWRKQPPITPSRGMSRKRLVLAPKRVRCTSCEAGFPALDVATAIEIGMRVDEAARITGNVT